MIHGSLRTSPPGSIFELVFATAPKVGLVLGGGDYGRTAQEVKIARKMDLPLGAFELTGGVARSVEGYAAVWTNEDPSDACHDAVRWLEDRLNSQQSL